MDNRHPGSAPDYTNAAIMMFGINLMWVFVVVWMVWGFVPVIAIALVINHLAERTAERRGITPAFARVRLSRLRNNTPQS